VGAPNRNDVPGTGSAYLFSTTHWNMVRGFDDLPTTPFIQTGMIVSLVCKRLAFIFGRFNLNSLYLAQRIMISFYGLSSDSSKPSGIYYYAIPQCNITQFGPSCLQCNCSKAACMDTYYGTGCTSCQSNTQGPQCLACPECNTTQLCYEGVSSKAICNTGVTGSGCRDCSPGFSGAACDISCATSCLNIRNYTVKYFKRCG